MKRSVLVIAAIAAVSMTVLAGAAFAAAPNATVTVTGTLAGVCHFDTVPAINIALDPLADATGTGNLTFWCTNGTSWTLGDPDGGSPGTYNGTLACSGGGCGASTIAYTLTYTNASGGPTTGKTDVKTSVLTATVPVGNFQDSPQGTYSQNVVFTIAP